MGGPTGNAGWVTREVPLLMVSSCRPLVVKCTRYLSTRVFCFVFCVCVFVCVGAGVASVFVRYSFFQQTEEFSVPCI